MAFEPPPPPPPGGPSFSGPAPVQRPPRPVTVTGAVGLMAAQVVLNIIGALTPFLLHDQIVEAYRKMPVKAGQPKIDPDTQFLTNVGGGACGALVGAIILAVLAFFLLRGSNVARIITWVLGGLSLCCSGVGIVGVIIVSGMGFPAAYIAVAAVTSSLGFLLTIAIIVLLALPPSNAFFKPKSPGQLY